MSPKRGLWALKEWYPNRNFEKKYAERGAPEKEEADAFGDVSVTSESEQLFAPRQIVPLRSAE